jgi:hypothetical protein
MTNLRTTLTPERLVGISLRGCLIGYDYQDVSCREYVWNAYTSTLGSKRAKVAISDLSNWVRQVRETSCRRIETYPTDCASFCCRRRIDGSCEFDDKRIM